MVMCISWISYNLSSYTAVTTHRLLLHQFGWMYTLTTFPVL